MAWACLMPEELSIVPRGLVCLANLDTRHQPVHRSIWELLDKERANAPLRYRLVDLDEQYPHSKAKVGYFLFLIYIYIYLILFVSVLHMNGMFQKAYSKQIGCTNIYI
jgi:hypothetical protein